MKERLKKRLHLYVREGIVMLDSWKIPETGCFSEKHLPGMTGERELQAYETERLSKFISVLLALVLTLGLALPALAADGSWRTGQQAVL